MSTTSLPPDITVESMLELMRKFEFRVAELEARLEEGAAEKRSWEHDKRLFQLVADNVDDLIAVVNHQGHRIWNNRAYFQVLGYKPEEMIGSYSLLEVHPDDQIKVASAFAETVRTGAGSLIEYRMQHKDGSWITLESHGRAVPDLSGNVEYIILVSRDISLRRQLEEEKAKGSRIETISAVAQGIAQEFNDIISGMRGYVTAARQSLPPGNPAVERLLEAERVSLRANDVMQRLSYLTDKSERPRQTIVPSLLLRDLANEATRNSVARCEFILPATLRNIIAEEDSIRRVFESVLTNAVQSMKTRGIIRLIGENVTINMGTHDAGTGLEPGHYVKIDIMDQGEGISDENRQRIFDPYFTTRPNAVGLGLTTALSIVKRAGGNILVKSMVNVGTTFSIFLPSESPGIARAPEPKAPEPQAELVVPAARRTALIMDDEPLVCEFASAAFEHLGFEVTVTHDGAQAIAAYAKARAKGHPHDLVVLDLMVPHGVGGFDAFQTLVKMNPSVKVILASGHTDHPVMKFPEKHGIKAALSKPYSIKKVQEAVDQAFLGVTL